MCVCVFQVLVLWPIAFCESIALHGVVSVVCGMDWCVVWSGTTYVSCMYLFVVVLSSVDFCVLFMIPHNTNTRAHTHVRI